MNFIDLFSGAGGLSEGFIKAGFNPLAHVEIDKAACNTLRTRTAYHYLLNNDKFHYYLSYLKRDITREKLYSLVPLKLMSSVINMSFNSANTQ
jgi:DNA (cytosine-5)-methyltransferase 1